MTAIATAAVIFGLILAAAGIGYRVGREHGHRLGWRDRASSGRYR